MLISEAKERRRVTVPLVPPLHGDTVDQQKIGFFLKDDDPNGFVVGFKYPHLTALNIRPIIFNTGLRHDPDYGEVGCPISLSTDLVNCLGIQRPCVPHGGALPMASSFVSRHGSFATIRRGARARQQTLASQQR
jgi:hypothetical protein